MPVYHEFLNQNAHRAYPFREDTNLVAINEVSVKLPSYLFVDLILTVAANYDAEVHLAQVAFVGGFLTAVFKDANGDTVTTLAVDTRAHTTNQGYPLVGQGNYADARGKVTLGNLTPLRTDLADGSYQFEAVLEACTVRPDLRGVRTLQVGSGDNLSALISGSVKLLEGSNIRLTYLPAINGIRIDAIEGAGLNEQTTCDDKYALPQPVRMINGIAIEDVQLIGDGKCVEITTSGNKISIRDKCSEPCCGCEELEFITTNMELLQSTLSRVESYASLLDDRITNMVMVILSSTKGG